MSRFTAEERIGIYEKILGSVSKWPNNDNNLCIRLDSYCSNMNDKNELMMIFPEYKKFISEFEGDFHCFYNNLIPGKRYSIQERNAHRISVLKSMIEDARKEVGK